MYFDVESKDKFVFPEDKRIEAYKRFLENLSNDEYLYDEEGIFKLGMFGRKKKIIIFENKFQIEFFSEEVQAFWQARDKSRSDNIVDLITREKIAKKLKNGEFKVETRITVPKLKVLDHKFLNIAKEFSLKFNETFAGIKAEIIN